MGNTSALEHICNKLNNNSYVGILSLRSQKLDDKGLEKLVQMLKSNKSIQQLNLGSLPSNFQTFQKIFLNI